MVASFGAWDLEAEEIIDAGGTVVRWARPRRNAASAPDASMPSKPNDKPNRWSDSPDEPIRADLSVDAGGSVG